MFYTFIDIRLTFVFIPIIIAATWALSNTIFALRNNIPKTRKSN